MKPLHFNDKLLPTQPEYSRLFDGSDFLSALCARVADIGDLGPEPQLELPRGYALEDMSSHPETLKMVQLILKLSGAITVLEIGSFIGRSAIYMARALPFGGVVATIEKGRVFATLAQRNAANNCPADRCIEVHCGDAMQWIPVNRRYDAVFIDGDKEHYLDYFLNVQEALNPGAVIMVDDCFFHGDALNETPTTAKGAGVKRFLEHVAGLKDWHGLALPLGNGLTILRSPT